MFGSMDLDYDYDMPGGDDFEDVTRLFHDAVQGMAPEDVILTDGFSLTDAMSAFEIGEPRMDSGMSLGQDDVSLFDPLAPLLPEELCWIIDRMFACEMSWHSGNTLSQTVFTLLYIHELSDLNPDMLPDDWPMHPDPNRPLELLTVVLRAAVFGLLKSCDLAWRELCRKRVYDIEDWQSEKCEVSLLEGVPVNIVLRRLEEACHWLNSSTLPPEQRDALLNRLILRRHILELLNLNVTGKLDSIRPLATLARIYLRQTQKLPSKTPEDSSRALQVFDPRVTRRLYTVIPIRVVELPEQAAVWQSIEDLLTNFEDVDRLREQHSIISWETFGSCSAWSRQKPFPVSYIRSLAQGIFFDRDVVLEQYPSSVLIEQFFLENLGVSYDSVSEILTTSWAGGDTLSLDELQCHLVQIVSNHIKLFWFNPPRRRRHLMRSLLVWQSIHESFCVLAAQVVVSNPHSVRIVNALPHIANIWKLGAAREVILSGFQQELYAPYERSLAYWLLARIIDQHLCSLGILRALGSPDKRVEQEWEYQLQFLRSLQNMCTALCDITSSTETPSIGRTVLNFRRRYKWLFASQDGSSSELLFEIPPLCRYPQDFEVLRTQTTGPARDSLKMAQESLSRLVSMNAQTLCGAEEANMRTQFARGLADATEQLLLLVNSAGAEISTNLIERLRWDPSYHPWFPSVIQLK